MQETTPDRDFAVFRRLIKQRLGFLATAYGFAEAEAHLLLPGMWVSCRNSTTQVVIYFEYENGLWLTIGRLATVNGQLTGGEQYALNDLLALRKLQPSHTVRMSGFDEGVMDKVLLERAVALQAYADDVLRGDFAVFPRLKEIVTERLAQLYPDVPPTKDLP